ncbi:MAG: hypothetical protein AAGC46_17530, partial [Solirubrobacteraceae bacterium]|nr:hypothetical protein [Patulibacter sp.]
AGLPSMEAVSSQLDISAGRIVFGHLHRVGPLPADDLEPWQPGDREFWNSGCWVYEPMLLSRATPPHPYWPGGALQIDDGAITVRTLLDDLDHDDLR